MPRAMLHNIGSLKKKPAMVEAERVSSVSVGVLEKPELEKFSETISAWEPSTEVADAMIDTETEIPLFEVEAPIFSRVLKNEEVFVTEMTQADKVEAACQKIDARVRKFIEEELRGRFVAVRV